MISRWEGEMTSKGAGEINHSSPLPRFLEGKDDEW
jgi:hypothetical protein